jgi:alkylation response protein AidB-like acyl-CoA dehydrogenase
MAEFLIDKRDIEFVLFEQLGLGQVTSFPRYADFDEQDFRMVLDEGIKVARDLLAPLNVQGDRVGSRFEGGKVLLPDGWKEAFETFAAGGWVAPHLSPEYGGQGLPLVMFLAVTEAFLAANVSFVFFPGLTAAAAHVIEAFGTDDQKATYIEKMYSGEWTGTMCLTEPSAGTAVGDLLSTAAEVPGEDYFHIKGNKIFITAGDGDIAGNIIHLVLARVEGDPAGSKGLSLFIVPKYRIGADGTPGESNNVVTTGIEHKMGINASPTCALSFGEDGPCQGWLLGERRQGIVAMFQMMNEARILCGLQGAGVANASYQQAVAYAKDRVQGTRSTDRSENPEKVAIIEHPDVRRNLLTMKAMGEGTRAMLNQVAFWHDLAANGTDDAKRAYYHDLVDLLTPICKAFSTDLGFRAAELGVQVLGGYGYTREYPLEQYLRDVKIASIYEGTNGVQALDLLGRKMRLKNGALFLNWLQMANELLQAQASHERLGGLVAAVDKAKNTLAETVFTLPALGKQDPDRFILQATPFLEMFGYVEVARVLVHQAVIADAALQGIYEASGAADAEARRALVVENREARFYDGKVKTATFFVKELMPRVFTLSRLIKEADGTALEMVF